MALTGPVKFSGSETFNYILEESLDKSFKYFPENLELFSVN